MTLKTMKINQCFLHGYMSQDKRGVPLMIIGDEDQLMLKKGEGFDEWMADTTGIINTQDLGHEVPFNEMNQEMLRRIVVAWLHGEEFEG